MDFSPTSLLSCLHALPAARRYLVAYSGGLDSHVLLHGLARLRPQLPGATLQAIHVHHGLSPRADAWVAHCAAVCAQLGIACVILRVDAAPRSGQSPEAAARHARYAALAGQMQFGDALLTAHHQDDQAETVLLQLLRGAGVRGLAAMPGHAPFAQGWLGRPLLGFSRAALRTYAAQEGLSWIEDPSNFDTGFERNFLRHEVLPTLGEHWPAYAGTLARAAQLQAEAAALLAELATSDVEALRAADGSLPISGLMALSTPRVHNILRHWIEAHGLPLPDRTHLRRIVEEVMAARVDANPRVAWRGAEVRRYRGRLYAMTPLTGHDPAQRLVWVLGAGPLPVPALGARLTARPAIGRGVSQAAAGLKVEVAFRRGGELCRPLRRAHHHSLKHLLQEWGVAPWRRDRVPLLYIGEELAAVIGYSVCEPFQARPGEAGWEIELHPDGCDVPPGM